MTFEAPPEMKKQYLERRRSEVTTAIKAEGEQKEKVVRTLAHQVLGNARTFGFLQLEAVAKKLQAAVHAAKHSEEDLNRVLKEFNASIDHLLRSTGTRPSDLQL